MKIGVQTANIVSVTDPSRIEEGFRLIHEAGFDCVDFNIDGLYPYGDIVKGVRPEFFDKSDEEILAHFAPYKAAAEKYQVAFHQAHAPFPTYVAKEPNDALVLNSLRKTIMVCGYLNCRYVVVHPHFLGYHDKLPPEEEWRVNIERYSLLIDEAKKHDVVICLENMFVSNRGRIYGAICSEMSEAVRYIDALNEIAGEKRFAFCFDTGHSLLASKDIYSAIMELGPRLAILHIHDNNGLQDQHLFPYTGIVDWDRFVQGLKDVGYQGVLSFETGNALNIYPAAVKAEALKLLSAIGREFVRRIEG
jgi:sugar phosphate isomerase/epimerase